MKKELIDGEVTQEEMDQARELWIKEVQRSVYNDKNFDQVKVSLSLFTDDKGILRCGGRLRIAPIPYDALFRYFVQDVHELPTWLSMTVTSRFFTMV